MRSSAWMETTLDSGPPQGGPYVAKRAGHVPIQRLTRTEFGIAVNGLLGIELDAEALLPAEIEVHGFDNIAAALSVSPAFLDQYVAAARFAARLAVGESRPKLASAHYAQPVEGDQPLHIDGLPLGTRGGMKFRHNFPADGEYRFTIPDVGVDLYSRAVETRHTLVILVDGREVFRQSVGGPEDLRIVDQGGAPGRAEIMKRFANIPVQVKAGTYDVAMTYIERARVESDEFVGFLPGDAFSRGDREPRLQAGVDVVGPFNSPGVSDTPSRRKIFICRPGQIGGSKRTALRRKGLRPPHCREPGATRVPPAGHERGHRFADAVLRQRASERFRCGHRAGRRRGAGQSRVPVPRDPDAGGPPEGGPHVRQCGPTASDFH